MSSTSNTTTPTTPNFQAIFDAALKDYSKKTGKDLCNLDHPLTSILDSRNSPDAILDIFREQATEFGEFRKGDSKLFNWLKPIVKVLHTISTNKVLGDSAGSVIPPAEAVFSAIHKLLSMAKDVSENYDSLVDIFECIENFLIRLSIYTEIPPDEAATMTEIVTKIMAELITVLALVTKQMKQGQLKKYAKRLLGEKEIKLVLDRLDRLTAKESKMTVVQTFDVVCRLVKKIQVVMEDGKASTDDMRWSLVLIQEITVNMNKMERDKSQEVFCRWLSAADPWVNQNITRKAHHRGTATWFTQGDIFKNWKAESSLMWIHGLPGSGKSVLCSSVIQDIQEVCRTGLATLAFFYFDFRDTGKQDARSLLSSLLLQLCHESDNYSKILFSPYSKHGNGTRQPSQGALIDCLKDMFNLPRQGELYIIVDALDECPDTSGYPTPREQVLAILRELVVLRLPHVHFCFTSRPEVDIRNAMEDVADHNVSLHEQVGQNQDILDYIESIFSSDQYIRRWKEEDKQLAKDTLLRGARGMFRWVFCQIETLRRCFPTSIRRALDELPETLDQTYEQTLLSIDKEKRDYAYRLFQCLVVSRRPLLVEELAELSAIDPNNDTIPVHNPQSRPENPEEFILSACSTLVAIISDGGQKIVQFSHFSVKEYLTSDRISISKHVSYFHVLPRPAHTLFARTCLSVLLHLDDHIDGNRIQDFPLASYAAQYWLDHARFEDVSRYVEDEMKRLFDPGEPHLSVSLWIHNPESPQNQRTEMPLPPSQTHLHYAASWDLHSIVKFLVIGHLQDVRSRNLVGNATPLHLASRFGHTKVARFLLGRGAELTAQDKDWETPLHLASRWGHLEVAHLLIERGADLTTRNEDAETALHLASRGGHFEFARMLIGQGANLMAQNEDGETALHLASRGGNFEFARMLIECGADLTTQNKNRETPLHLTSPGGHLEVALMLIERGADLAAQSEDGETALHLASRGSNFEFARMLIKCGADLTAQNKNKETPLHLTSRRGHLEVALMLIECGADLTAQNEDGETALHLALRGGNLEFARILIEHGADVLAQNKDGETPLHLASQEGHAEVACMLIERGADVSAQEVDRWTPLHLASQEGHTEVARMLIERGADVSAQEVDGWTPLHLASQEGQVEVACMLIKHGAHVSAQEEMGGPPSSSVI